MPCPAPVGMTAKASLPARILSITDFCPALNESYPNKIFNACSGVSYLSLLHVSFVSVSEAFFDNIFICHPNCYVRFMLICKIYLFSNYK